MGRQTCTLPTRVIQYQGIHTPHPLSTCACSAPAMREARKASARWDLAEDTSLARCSEASTASSSPAMGNPLRPDT